MSDPHKHIPYDLRLLSASFMHTDPPMRGNAELCSSAASEIERLQAELDRAWRERNEFANKVHAWNDIVIAEALPVRASPGREWGPGGDDSVTVPQITPRRLTELLDELASARAALEGRADD